MSNTPNTNGVRWHFIPIKCPSLKNSKQIVKIGNFSKLIPSKAHQKYAKQTAPFWNLFSREFKRDCKDVQKPIRVGFFFVRDSKQIFDFTSPIDTCQDLMVKHGWIPDDNCNEIIPVVCGYDVNTKNAGTYICVLRSGLSLPTPYAVERIPQMCDLPLNLESGEDE